MPSISIPAAISAVAGIGNAIIGGNAAGKAADTQSAAARRAGDLQMRQFQATQAALNPFISAGASALPHLQGLMGIAPGSGPSTQAGGGRDEKTILAQIKQGLTEWGASGANRGAPGIIADIDKGASLQEVQRKLQQAAGSTTNPKNTAFLNPLLDLSMEMPTSSAGPLGTSPGGAAQPFSPQQFLENTPGYKFALDQGLKSTQAGYSSRGLGGAALKGAAEYSTGLADQTYGNQVARFMDMSKLGASSAGELGRIGASQTGQIGNTLTSGAAAQAGGQMGTANAISGGVGALGQNVSDYFTLTGMKKAGLGMFDKSKSSLSSFSGGGPMDPEGFADPRAWSPYGYAKG